MVVTLAAVLADVSMKSMEFLQHAVGERQQYFDLHNDRIGPTIKSMCVAPLCILPPRLLRDLPLLCEVRLVAHQDDNCTPASTSEAFTNFLDNISRKAASPTIPMLPLAFFCSSDTQCLAFWKDSAFVMSYTTAAAEAPLTMCMRERQCVWNGVLRLHPACPHAPLTDSTAAPMMRIAPARQCPCSAWERKSIIGAASAIFPVLYRHKVGVLPDLKFHSGAVRQVHRVAHEGRADGDLAAGVELPSDIAQHQA